MKKPKADPRDRRIKELETRLDEVNALNTLNIAWKADAEAHLREADEMRSINANAVCGLQTMLGVAREKIERLHRELEAALRSACSSEERALSLNFRLERQQQASKSLTELLVSLQNYKSARQRNDIEDKAIAMSRRVQSGFAEEGGA